MKNYDETAQTVLSRIRAEEMERKHRKKVLLTTVLPAFLIVSVSLGSILMLGSDEIKADDDSNEGANMAVSSNGGLEPGITGELGSDIEPIQSQTETSDTKTDAERAEGAIKAAKQGIADSIAQYKIGINDPNEFKTINRVNNMTTAEIKSMCEIQKKWLLERLEQVEVIEQEYKSGKLTTYDDVVAELNSVREAADMQCQKEIAEMLATK